MNDDEFKEFHKNLKPEELRCDIHNIAKRVVYSEVRYNDKVFAEPNTMICLGCRSDFFKANRDKE